MAVAAPALHHHLWLRFSNPITRTRPSLPGGGTAFLTHLQIHQNSARISLISCSSTSQSTEASTDTPESCVNLGLQLFSKGRVKDALVQFETALSLDPNPIEAQAALYNKACCHAYKGEGRKAADCLRTALREYDLKFGTILNDPDLASFRALPEFKELQEEARLGGEDIGYSFRRDLKLISGDDAPDLWETAGNVAVNVGGLIVLVALFLWENKKEEEQLSQISRDENLSRLPLRLSTNRVVELVQLRDTVRPVILAGKKETVALSIQQAARFRTELLRRGVLLVPVIWDEVKVPQIEKKGFGTPSKAAAALPSIGISRNELSL
ncbi:protein LOW PSII ACCUMULATION 1 [Pyrus ussuriensis x Pyrus communis]|uniref:Protein LOW PSII ACCUMULATION 1 n=1 Tax=Pyrus ussuriensis x Pyrus communis TaxID=2448454 RepID=A0A5N5H7V0_9ROSA|nr:protein LOW PSII ACCUMULATION 1 [Pyrus ussuriensis x Pyrus communis]